MSEAAPKRRWLRFSLRTLFVVVTVVGLGMAQWNRARSLEIRASLHREEASKVEAFPAFDGDEWSTKVVKYHRAMADRFERCIWQPWVTFESVPPLPSYTNLIMPPYSDEVEWKWQRRGIR